MESSGGIVLNPLIRSRSITWAAIITILASLPPLAVGLLGVTEFFDLLPHRNPNIFYSGFEILSGVVITLIPGIWGLATGIGLLALKSWARISIILFSAVNIAFMVVIFGFLLTAFWVVTKRTPILNIWSLAYYVGVPIFYVGISIWLLILFDRPAVAKQFERRREDPS